MLYREEFIFSRFRMVDWDAVIPDALTTSCQFKNEEHLDARFYGRTEVLSKPNFLTSVLRVNWVSRAADAFSLAEIVG